MNYQWGQTPPNSTFDREPLVPTLTSEEVSEYLDAHIKNGACPLCTGHSFVAMALGPDFNTYPAIPVYRLLPENEIERVMKAVPLVVALCDGCGWLAPFLRTAVEAWVDARREPPLTTTAPSGGAAPADDECREQGGPGSACLPPQEPREVLLGDQVEQLELVGDGLEAHAGDAGATQEERSMLTRCCDIVVTEKMEDEGAWELVHYPEVGYPEARARDIFRRMLPFVCSDRDRCLDGEGPCQGLAAGQLEAGVGDR